MVNFLASEEKFLFMINDFDDDNVDDYNDFEL